MSRDRGRLWGPRTATIPDGLVVSPMVELEVEYSSEIGRIRRDAAAVRAHPAAVIALRATLAGRPGRRP